MYIANDNYIVPITTVVNVHRPLPSPSIFKFAITLIHYVQNESEKLLLHILLANAVVTLIYISYVTYHVV